VSGVKINGSEYLLSQYADDTALLLSDDKYSLEQSLNIFDCFCVCAGLRVNLDKTATIWDDPRLGSDKKMLSEKYLAWNTSGNLNFWGFISIFIKKKTILWKILVNNKKGK
jgi:hypothetical protein